jgi:hypothetical protein
MNNKQSNVPDHTTLSTINRAMFLTTPHYQNKQSHVPDHTTLSTINRAMFLTTPHYQQ